MPNFNHSLEMIPTDNFTTRLQRHPQLRAQIEALLDVVENSAGDVVTADEAEQRVVEDLRRLGHTALQSWAERKQAVVEAGLPLLCFRSLAREAPGGPVPLQLVAVCVVGNPIISAHLYVSAFQLFVELLSHHDEPSMTIIFRSLT